MTTLKPVEIFVGSSRLHTSIWQRHYFPQDLPEDWQIDYYSNEFQVILMSAHLAQQISEWPEDFIVILETETTPDTNNASCYWVGQQQIQHPLYRKYTAINSQSITGWRASFVDFEVISLKDMPLDNLRTMRKTIDLLKTQCQRQKLYLLLDGSPVELSQIITLVELLNFRP